MNNLLAKIRKGMRVYDQNQHEIGEVDYVQFGDEDPLRPGTEAVTSGDYGWRGESIADAIVDVFAPDNLPDTLKSRLLLYGFIRVDAPGLFDADRYILPNQIESVNGDRITLKVTKHELVQRL
jgi:hypothetical protein